MLNKADEQEIMNKIIKRYDNDTVDKIPAERIKQLRSEYHIRGRYTYCKVSSEYDNNSLMGIGFSKCNPVDKMIPDIGKKISFSRACKDYLSHLTGDKEKYNIRTIHINYEVEHDKLESN